jgi:16S rRNA (guanine527-N7)-methyltransferase
VTPVGVTPVGVTPVGAPGKALTPADFAKATGVSRETLARLEGYAALLVKWQKTINLVARDSLGDLWRRHMLDSAALWPLIPTDSRVLVDLGSGAGFPGLVLAILGVPDTHLIESDARKCAFLGEAARLFAPNPVRVHRGRIESLDAIPADVVTARALTGLDNLLDYAQRFVKPAGVCLFPKGAKAEDELTLAGQRWTMTAERFPNPADSSGILLRIKELNRRP